NRGGASRLVGFLIYLCDSPLALLFGTRNADLKPFASIHADRFLKRRGSTASRSMSNCFIWRIAPVCTSAKFRFTGTMLKAARLVFSATACGCYAKSSRCEHKHSLTKVERVVFNALA